ncbi:MAG TPA: DUF3825 domain-containing protein [Thermomonospora sp.]|nr:DUF3825 domain-containing protein [Thermomonospora sp.]
MTPHDAKSAPYNELGRSTGPLPYGGTNDAGSPAETSAPPFGANGSFAPSRSGPGPVNPLPAPPFSGAVNGGAPRAPQLGETQPPVPQAPPAARRPQRALYKHASLGPLRVDGEQGGDDFFDLLARLAEPEPWGGPTGARTDATWVLREYVEWAFERLYQQRRILTSADGTRSVFHTGLVTPQQEAIYGLFAPNRDPDGAPWQLQGWYPESERELHERFPELPPAAAYAEEPAELVYDWRRELSVNPKLLLESKENLAALPAPLNSNPYQAGLVLEGALRRAEERVRRDYRAAVPCWDPAAERVQLLLPLSLTTPDTVDTALVVTRDDAQEVYRGHVLLGLDTAYARARQLARPRDWLTPPVRDRG